MKILELSLQAFGPFTDVTLDLSGGREGLHLVYGPNEAGKSSALRALRQALFGFPVQTSDDFLHSYQKLRVGMRLRDGDGREIAFVRRKGAKNTLLAADGSTPLPDSTLERLLGGMTEAEFSRRFALDHDELVAGGKSILEGAGELGQLLFQAGGGLKDLLEVQRTLDRELEALFKPSGIRPRINAGLAELKEAKAVVREGSLPSTEWAEHDAAYRRAAEQLEAIEARLESTRAEKRRLERIADALPVLALRRQCQEDRELLGPVVLLPDDFTEQRHQAIGQFDAARTAESAATRAIAELDDQLEALVVPEDLLAEAEAIERLRDALAGYRKAQDALPAERGRLRLIEAELRELLAELRPDGGGGPGSPAPGGAPDPDGAAALLDEADAIRPGRAQKATISRLTADLARLTAEQDQAGARVAELAARLESEQAELDRIEAPGDPESLAIALRQARDQGDLDAQLDAARARLDQADAEAARALAQLPLWSGPLDAAANLAVPAAETVDRFEAELAEIDAELARLRSARDAAESEVADAGSRLSELRESAGVLPTEDDLATARARRDEIWRLIRRTVETSEDRDSGRGERSLRGSGRKKTGPPPTPDPDPRSPIPDLAAFEESVQQADACADRLRREAERVAAQAGARAAMDRARQRLASLDDQARQASIRADEVRARWRVAWEPSGIEPLSPREMRGWLQSRQSVAQKAAEAEARRAELDALRSRSAAHRAAIAGALAALGEATAHGGIRPREGEPPGEPDLQMGSAGDVSGRGEATAPGSAGSPGGSPSRGLSGAGPRGPAGKPSDPTTDDEPAPRATDEALAPLRDRAEAVLARLSKAAARRDELLQSIGQLRRQVEAARAQVQAVGDRLGAWRASWGRAVAPLGLPPEASPEEAEAVLERAASLAARVKDAREARARIESLEREADQFAGEVRALWQRVAAAPGSEEAATEARPTESLSREASGGRQPPVRSRRQGADAPRSPSGTESEAPEDPTAVLAAAQDLIRRLAAARQAADRRDALRLRREQERAAARSARRDREAAEHRIDLLCREAGCASPDDLPAAERASLAARRLQDRQQELDSQLGRLCGHEPLESFRQSAMATDVDRLPDRIAALAAEVDRLDAERGRLNQELGHRRGELARMDGEGRAAEAAERVEHLKSRLTHDVEEYARLRLAAVVLREAIERHRQRTQGPVLDRASRLFAALTIGSFEGLRVEYDDHDEPVLQALRPGGSDAVAVRGLSLGTADQLYLALRLASLETAIRSHGPLPLIGDDILIQFDDRRTAAALQILADLSDQTQVMLFTHHEHVCELAQSCLPDDKLFIHRLPGRAPARDNGKA